MHKSKPEPVRRLEVFTGAGRRRTWTAEQKAQILAESYESGEKVSAVARRHGLTPQQLLLRQLQRAQFGRRSEKLDPDQLHLAFEDIGQAIAASETDDDKRDPAGARAHAERRRVNRGALPAHLPRVHVTIEPDDTKCSCCQAPMHVIGEETSQRLDVIPAQYRVIVTHRPKYACRACEQAVVQAPATPSFVRAVAAIPSCASCVTMLLSAETSRDSQATSSSCNVQSAANETCGAPTLRPAQ